ncbi:MAG: hypothetical protein Q7J05_03200 [Paludibacter sp.]|nr:hypothetical protein [Paludibacter sp.]
MRKTIFAFVAMLLFGGISFAQVRSYSQTGLNEFESPKAENETFEKVKLKIGGNFTQSFQALSHSNTADVTANPAANLVKIGPGFNTAVANLNFDIHLAEGVYMNMALYLSSRHHNETWVKGGYIRFDKLPFLKMDFLDEIMKYTTIKVGHMEVNYGDAHFRRSDNGNAMYNPFIENYILDAFATEIGAEVDVTYDGFLAALSVTNGQIKGNILAYDPIPDASNGKQNPSFIAKVGYDKQLTDMLRARLTGSVYHTAGSIGNTLYGGDRAGSHYYGVMDNAVTTGTFTSGRYNPGFGDKVTSMMGNLFLKYGGLESFTTLETSSGRGRTEITGERNANQIATDLLYRFGNNENFWIGARYNVASARPSGYTDDITIDRIAVSAGWYVTKNLMTKLEYVTQNYDGFAATDIRNGGKFIGIVLEAVVGF